MTTDIAGFCWERVLCLMPVRLTGRIALVAHLAAPEHAGLLPVLRGLPQSDSQVSNLGLVVGPPPTAMHVCVQTGISSPVPLVRSSAVNGEAHRDQPRFASRPGPAGW
jgi:hypothetical protein